MGNSSVQNGHGNIQINIFPKSPHDKNNHPSWLGIVCAILISCIILAFAFGERITEIYVNWRNGDAAVLFDNPSPDQTQSSETAQIPSTAPAYQSTFTPKPIPTTLPASTYNPVVTEHTTFVATASSVYQLQHNHTDYSVGADMAVDGNLETAWNEGAPGLGIGEWICLQPSDGIPRQYKGFRIANGFQYHTYKKDDRWIKNCRVSSLEVYGDNTYIDTFAIADNCSGYQDISFQEPVYCLSLKFVIKGVYEGTNFSDACISEIRPF